MLKCEHHVLSTLGGRACSQTLSLHMSIAMKLNEQSAPLQQCHSIAGTHAHNVGYFVGGDGVVVLKLCFSAVHAKLLCHDLG